MNLAMFNYNSLEHFQDAFSGILEDFYKQHKTVYDRMFSDEIYGYRKGMIEQQLDISYFHYYLYSIMQELSSMKECTTVIQEECLDVIVEKINYGALYSTHFLNMSEDKVLTSSGEWRMPNLDDMNNLFSAFDEDWVDYEVSEGQLTSALLPAKTISTEYWESPNELAENKFNFNIKGSGVTFVDINVIHAGLKQITAFYIKNPGQHLVLQTTKGTNSGIFNQDLSLQANLPIRICRNATESEELLADGTFVLSYVGNDLKTYPTVKIGKRVWITENLCETKYRNGSSIAKATNENEFINFYEAGPFYNFYNFDDSFGREITQEQVCSEIEIETCMGPTKEQILKVLEKHNWECVVKTLLCKGIRVGKYYTTLINIGQ